MVIDDDFFKKNLFFVLYNKFCFEINFVIIDWYIRLYKKLKFFF